MNLNFKLLIAQRTKQKYAIDFKPISVVYKFSPVL